MEPHLDTYWSAADFAKSIGNSRYEFVVSSSDGRRIVASVTSDCCPCVFRISTGLPCQHILAVRYLCGLSVFDRALVLERWTREFDAINQQLVTVSNSSPIASYVPSERLDAVTRQQQLKQAISTVTDLASVAANCLPETFEKRLKVLRDLRDQWKSETILQVPDGSVLVADEVRHVSSSSRLGDELVNELVDLASNIDSGAWNTYATVNYSDIKLPSKKAKRRGRPPNSHNAKKQQVA